jgi:hypothetical protein
MRVWVELLASKFLVNVARSQMFAGALEHSPGCREEARE